MIYAFIPLKQPCNQCNSEGNRRQTENTHTAFLSSYRSSVSNNNNNNNNHFRVQILYKFVFTLLFKRHNLELSKIFPWGGGPKAGHSLFILQVSRSHTVVHHSRYDSSGRVISSSQRPLPNDTQHSKQTSMPQEGFESTVSAGEQPQTQVLEGVVSGTGPSPVQEVRVEQGNMQHVHRQQKIYILL